jgi:hypothetical protein
MAVVGALLKETTRVGYRLSFKKRQRLNTDQNKILLNLISKSEKTKFGQNHAFTAILYAKDPIFQFQSNVPLVNYDGFYPWVERMLNQEKNVCIPGKVNHFALSSGTTKGSSKRIPVSDKMIRQFQKTTFEQLLNLHELNLPKEFYAAQVLTIGGSTRLTACEGYWEGDLSGILQKHKSFILRPFAKPGPAIAQMKNWNEKMEAIIQKAPNWDIGVIAGVPSWILMVLQGIIERYKLKNIHEIWPNFQLYLHGGVFLDSYQEKINSLCGKPIYFLDTYLASEGYFAYQKHPLDKGMHLLDNHGIYYEFVEEQYFSQLAEGGSAMAQLPTLALNEVEPNRSYALVISTVSGLWRYVIGDVIRFIDMDKKELIITGRVSHYISMVGEHLSVENLTTALRNTCHRFQISCEEFCVVPGKQKDRHYWYLGSTKLTDNRHFEVVLDEELERLNDDYRALRKHLIRSPKVKFLPLAKFYEFMEHKGKTGGQNKFPRVMNSEQTTEWERFLNQLEW